MLLRNEQKETIAGAINDLPDDLRMAITLHELEGPSHEDIAEPMDCPISTVRSRIFRTRDAIDVELKLLLK